MKVNAVTQPIVGVSNLSYVNNRSPLLPCPMIKLPLGSIRPKGWLKHQLELMASGMTGRLPEVSPHLKEGPMFWIGGVRSSWEQPAYWLRGFYPLAVLTGKQALLEEAQRWLEALFASQDEDGYFGPKWFKSILGDDGQRFCDHWAQMILLDLMVTYFEHAADGRVMQLMKRYFEFMRNLPDENFFPVPGDDFGRDWVYLKYSRERAGDLLPHLYWLYNHTGDAWLLDLAARVVTHMARPTDEWLDHHVVNFMQRFRYQATYFTQSKEKWHLATAEYWYRQHMATWGQAPRGIFAADERLRHGCVDPRQGFETCAMVEGAKSFYILGRITGQTVYADRCEDILFNHFPAAFTPEMKALHYLTASNMPQLDRTEDHEFLNKGTQISYSPYDVYNCCQHNHSMGWPWFVQNLWQASADNGLVAWMYPACVVTAKVGQEAVPVMIDTQTEYPFKGCVKMAITCSEPVVFPLYLRVPAWCQGLRVSVNGKELDVSGEPGEYVRIERKWSKGDTTSIEMPMETSLTEWPRNGSVTVDRGPLSYSIRIEERYRRCGGTDEWPEWEVFPNSPWNYGLVIDRDNPPQSLEVQERGAVADQPWSVDNAPIEIRAKGRRIPQWGLENETVQELRQSPIRSDEPEEQITLVPMGCSRLRISCIPTIGNGPDARQWPKAPLAVRGRISSALKRRTIPEW